MRGYDRMTLCTYRDVPWNVPVLLRGRLQSREVTHLAPSRSTACAPEIELGLDVRTGVHRDGSRTLT